MVIRSTVEAMDYGIETEPDMIAIVWQLFNTALLIAIVVIFIIVLIKLIKFLDKNSKN